MTIKRVIHSLVFVLMVFVFFENAKADICGEELGPYFVNIGVISDAPGFGMDDVFEADIRWMTPKTEEQVGVLRAFPYYDGNIYRWEEKNNEYRLFKHEPGKRPVRVHVLGLVFPAQKRTIYNLKIRRSNPKVYRAANLEDKLEVLGVMGVIFRGKEGTVEFINRSQPESSADGEQFMDVSITGPEIMLRRFARDKEYNVPEGIAEYNSFRKLLLGYNLQGNMIDISKQYTWAEADVVEGINAKANWAMTALFQDITGSDESGKLDIAKKIGDIALPMNVKIIYKNCIPKGDYSYGSPKAVFLPVLVKDPAGPYYPLYVFPSAFRSEATLTNAILRELYHAQWWNAVANINEAKGTKRGVLREALLRTTLANIEADINTSLPLPKFEYGEGAQKDLGILFTHRYLFMRPVRDALTSGGSGDIKLPWTADTGFIISEGPVRLHTEGDVYYNNALAKVPVKKAGLLDKLKFWQKSGKTDVQKEAERVEGLTKRFLTTLFTGAELDAVSGEKKKELVENLVKAITHGYTLTKEQRNKRLEINLTALKGKLKDYMGLKDEDLDLSLLDGLKNKGFAYDDIEWLYALTQKIENTEMPLYKLQGDTFGKRLRYLVETKKLKKIDGLDMGLAGKEFLLSLADLDQFKKTADKLVQDSDKNFEVAKKKKEDADKDINDKEKQERVKGIDIGKAQKALDDLKKLKTDTETAETELRSAEATYRENTASKIKVPYEVMEDMCKDLGIYDLTKTGLDAAFKSPASSKDASGESSDGSGQEMSTMKSVPEDPGNDCSEAVRSMDVAMNDIKKRKTVEDKKKDFINKKKTYDEKKDELWKKRIEILKLTGHNANVVNFKEVQQGSYQREKGLKTWEEFAVISLTEYFTGRASDSKAYEKLSEDMGLLRGQ